MTQNQLEALLAAARAAENTVDAAQAEDAFFRALLDYTIYAHVPLEPVPPDVIRFIQFIRPDNGQTVLPFFSDREQAEVAGGEEKGIVAMSGRRLLELTLGAALMLNPNRERVTLYPPEVSALLSGRALGYLTHETLLKDEQIGLCLPSVPTDELVLVLRALFAREPAVRVAYLTELHRGEDFSDVSLMLTLVVIKGNEERLVQLTSLELKSLSQPPPIAVLMCCVAPDVPLPPYCKHGVQFYGA